MNYLSVGTNNLSTNLFLDIKNTENIKPIGGLWATIQKMEFIHYNEWVDHLCSNPYILFFHKFDNPYRIPAVYITLKNSANIFILDSDEKIKFLKEKYPFNDWIDFEKLSRDYDGIFIDLTNINKGKHQKKDAIIKNFSVNTLILFNLSCIDFYKQAEVDLTNTTLGNPYEFPEYTIKINSQKLKIEQAKNEIQLLIEKIKRYMLDNNIKPSLENYEIIKKVFQEAINKALISENSSQKEALLIRKVFNQF